MVQVLVQMPGDVAEWGLVELQGQLETRDKVPLDTMHIGDLHFNSKGTPQLILGHHLLTGKVVELDKPFAILRKRSVLDESGLNDSRMELESGTELNQDKEAKSVCGEYEVVALISKKILFKNRPKPIITKTAIKKIKLY